MFNFGRKKQQIVCPKCLNPVDGAEVDKVVKCPVNLDKGGCYQPFPIRYIRDFFTAETLPIQVFGWSGHGKTVFLDTLRLFLFNMRKVWPEYTFQSISQTDLNKEQELRRTLRVGVMPEPTQLVKDLSQVDVYIMKLEKIPYYRDKWLIISDYPGELFRDFTTMNTNVMPFLKKSNTTFFIISISMITNKKRGHQTENEGLSIDQLMNIYIETMLRMEEADKRDRNTRDKFSFSGQKRQVIVVITMADDLIGHIPQSVTRYLQNDNLWARLHSPNSQPFTQDEIQTYYRDMWETSKNIREWLLSDTENAPGGANLVGLLERTGIVAHYCMISAVGFEPDNKNPMPIQPKRVIDPFLWALEFDRQLKG